MTLTIIRALTMALNSFALLHKLQLIAYYTILKNFQCLVHLYSSGASLYSLLSTYPHPLPTFPSLSPLLHPLLPYFFSVCIGVLYFHSIYCPTKLNDLYKLALKYCITSINVCKVGSDCVCKYFALKGNLLIHYLITCTVLVLYNT